MYGFLDSFFPNFTHYVLILKRNQSIYFYYQYRIKFILNGKARNNSEHFQ